MSRGTPRVPALARWIVARTAPRHRRESMLGDLEEEFTQRAERAGTASARRWYWRQALGSVKPNLTRRTESAAHARGGDGMDGFLKDVRYALRAVVRRPLFAAVVALTLALGIGANTVIFSAVNGMILHPFPFPEPDRIVGVGTAYPHNGQELSFFENSSPAEWEDVRDQVGTLEDVIAFDLGNRQIMGDGPPQNVFSAFWWGDALRTLRMSAFLGRGFTDEEIRTGARSAVLSHRIWQERFGGDSTLVGSTLSVNGEPHTVVGVAPPGVLFYGADLWTIMPVPPSEYPRGRRQFEILGRIREGATLAGVNAELQGIASQVEGAWVADNPEYRDWRLEARTWTDINVATMKPAGLILMGAVGFLLLLVCTNVANMLLARAQTRRREMAVRTALGAGRTRILRQLLTESVLLSLGGGILGLGLAVAGTRGLQAFIGGLGLPVPGDIRIDRTVLAFTALVSVAAGVLFGLAPAIQSLRGRAGTTLRAEGGAATGSRSRQALQRVFVAVEVALALVLLAGGGLLVNTLLRLNRVDPGFDADHVLTMRLTVPPEKYSPEEIQAFFQDLSQRVEGLPGVRAAAAGLQYPGVAFSRRNFSVEGAPPSSDGSSPRALATIVTHGYFDALGIPVVRGRSFNASDGPGGLPVAVVNESAARVLFPGRDPLGQRLRLGEADAQGPWFEVVGVAADVRNRGLDQPPEPEVYAAQEQIGQGTNQLFLLVRTTQDPRALLPAVRRTVQELDADQPIYAIATARERFAASNASRRATAAFLAIFAAIALVLAAVGIYAVVSYAVSERTREIGLRMALGAESGRVRRLVVGQALLPVAAGTVAGLALAALAGRGMSQILFQVSGSDPTTLGAVTTILLAVAFAASWIPARRASRMDPVRALTSD